MPRTNSISLKPLRGVQVRVTASAQAALFLTPLLVEIAGSGIKIKALNSGLWSLEVCMPVKRWHPRAVCQLHAVCRSLSPHFSDPAPPIMNWTMVELAERPGKGEKRFFRPFLATQRLQVCPPGRKAPPLQGFKTLELEVGKARGTGIHPATRSCLRLLEQIIDQGPPGRTLDIGTGTGILALAAAQLGVERILALDLNPHAVGVARRNVRRNELTGHIKVKCWDVIQDGGAYPLVTAQWSHKLIKKRARALVRCLTPGGCLIAGGIWWKRRRQVLAPLFPHLQVVKVDREAWWGGILLRKL